MAKTGRSQTKNGHVRCIPKQCPSWWERWLVGGMGECPSLLKSLSTGNVKEMKKEKNIQLGTNEHFHL